MSETNKSGTSRREFMRHTGRIAAATALATAVPHVHAAENNTIQLALIGCRRPWHRRSRQRPLGPKRPDQAGGHGRRLRGPP